MRSAQSQIIDNIQLPNFPDKTFSVCGNYFFETVNGKRIPNECHYDSIGQIYNWINDKRNTIHPYPNCTSIWNGEEVTILKWADNEVCIRPATAKHGFEWVYTEYLVWLDEIDMSKYHTMLQIKSTLGLSLSNLKSEIKKLDESMCNFLRCSNRADE